MRVRKRNEKRGHVKTCANATRNEDAYNRAQTQRETRRRINVRKRNEKRVGERKCCDLREKVGVGGGEDAWTWALVRCTFLPRPLQN